MDDAMHIVFTRFPYESQLGGMETMVINLAKALREKGHIISFVGSCPVLLKLFEEHDFKVTKLIVPKSPVTKWSLLVFIVLYPFILFQMGRIARMVHKGDAIYMLSLPEKLALTKMAYQRGAKVVWGEHESLQHQDGTWRSWLFRNPLLRRYKRLSQYATVVPVSQTLAKQYKALGGVHHLTVIENGIDMNYFSPTYANRYEKSSHTFIVGTVARLSPGKGGMEFLQMAQLLIPKIPPIHFMLAGDGPQREQMEAYIKQHHLASHVTLFGEVPYNHMRSVYNLFDISVFLSQEPETFGLAPLESMAMQKPTILTSVFGFLDEEAKTKLLVVEPYQIDKAVEWVEKLFQDASFRTHVVEEAYHFVSRRFSFSTMVDRYEKVLSDSFRKVA